MLDSIAWDDSLLVNVAKIDEEHKRFVSVTKSLYEALRSKEPGDAEKRTLVELIEYSKYHFSTEKELMERHHYPEMDDHMNSHREFINKLSNLCKKHQIENIEVSRDILALLVGWIVNHIMVVDRRLGDFLNEKGVK